MAAKRITTSSTAEYFAKNLQQVGFSSPTKAVLTTVKEALDNALDACEENSIAPEINIVVKKVGKGSLKNTDQILVCVEDNGPGLDIKDIPKVFGEYLASSKFGRGRCSRGQQGIGISAATTWAMQTTAKGARIITKQGKQRKAISCTVIMDLKNNKGLIKDKTVVDWDKDHGTSVEFLLDGRIQLNGEAGLINYLRGNILLNPHMTIKYQLADLEEQVFERVSDHVPKVPDATAPHPHTMKLGEFMAHGKLFGKTKVENWLKEGFSRIAPSVINNLNKVHKVSKKVINGSVEAMSEKDFRDLFLAIQEENLKAPSTHSVLSVGEDGLALSISRLGDIDYFSVLTRKPTIADFKPVQVEVAVARRKSRAGDSDETVQVLRFANRVPLQFDKAGCAIVKAITSVNWRNYGLKQPRGSLPHGPYVIAVSVVSPFIKFKNASKETIDASDELVEEIRLALMRAGQRLSRYLRRETKAGELQKRVEHIEKFSPILVETLGRLLGASSARKKRAEEGLKQILERDTKGIKEQLQTVDEALTSYLEEKKSRLSGFFEAEKQMEAERKSKEQESGQDADSEQDANDSVKADAERVVRTTTTSVARSGEAASQKAPAKKTTRNAASKKAVSKKALSKKITTKKKAAKKKSTPKATKKAAGKKARSGSTRSKKVASKKKTTAKASSAKKKTTAKKATNKKTGSKKTTKKTATKKKARKA